MNDIEWLKRELLRQADTIAQIVISRYTGKNGLLVKIINAQTGKILSQQAFIEDFGDYTQNIAYLGTILNKKEYGDWAVRQIILGSRLAQQENGYFYTKITTKDTQSKTGFGKFNRIGSNVDIFEGLVSTYEVTKNEQILDIAKKLASFIAGFINKDCSLSLGYFDVGLLKFKVPLTGPLIYGNFGEELVNLHKITNEHKYLQLAERLLSYWYENEYFKKAGFFPFKQITVLDSKITRQIVNNLFLLIKKRSIYLAEMAKFNTNLISAFLELYTVIKQEKLKNIVYKWCYAVENKLMDVHGFFYGLWDEKKKQQSEGRFPLVQNHHILNIFIDAYRIFEDEYFLEIAQKNADFWLKNQSSIGLFPEFPLREDRSSQRACLDSQTDYMVNLLKLYCLTREERYLHATIKCIKAIFKYYPTPHGLIWSVDSRSGKVICVKQHLKFITLFLKALLLLYEILNNRDITKNRLLYLLSRDR